VKSDSHCLQAARSPAQQLTRWQAVRAASDRLPAAGPLVAPQFRGGWSTRCLFVRLMAVAV